MIAPMNSNKSGVDDKSASSEPQDAAISEGRRRSWENRGRSQVIFNGPPSTDPSGDEERTEEEAQHLCVNRQVSSDVAVQSA